MPHLFSFIAGFFTAIFAEPIRQRIFKPKLELKFENNDDYIALTPEKTEGGPIRLMRNAYYIRIKVTNTKYIEAKDCRAYLINIEKLDENSSYKPTIYCDSIPLAWSCQNIGEQYRALNINKGANQFVDIVTTRENFNKFFPQIKLTPFRYESIFEDKGKFRFTIQITASNANPEVIKLIFEWNGAWNKFKVYKN